MALSDMQTQIIHPTFLLRLTLQDKFGKTNRLKSVAGQRAEQWPLNEGKLNENAFLAGTDFLDVFLGGPFVELFTGHTTDSRWQVSLVLIAIATGINMYLMCNLLYTGSRAL